MDEIDEPPVATVGEQLRAAREAKKLSLEDIAAQTRIPRRHLESLELGDWERLPAPTYTMGFAKSYATAIGLDRTEIGDQLRAEMGGMRPDSTVSEVFAPADPARTMPKWLVLAAIAAIILLVALMSWMNNRSLRPEAEAPGVEADAPGAPATAPAPAPTASGPVVLTALTPVWLQVSERGGAKLFEGVLAEGQRYEVPSTATAPVLRTGKPEALRITVGTAEAPAVGAPAATVSNVSLLGPDLMRGPASATAPATNAPAAQQQPAPRPRQTASQPAASGTQASSAPPSPPAAADPAVNNSAAQ